MRISPADATVAARSFPRRWRALFARVAGDPDSENVLRRRGASSPSAAELAAAAADALRTTAEALDHRSLPPEPDSDELARVDAAADVLVQVIVGTTPEEWQRPGAIDALAAGIEDAAAAMRQAERVLDEVRGRP